MNQAIATCLWGALILTAGCTDEELGGALDPRGEWSAPVSLSTDEILLSSQHPRRDISVQAKVMASFTDLSFRVISRSVGAPQKLSVSVFLTLDQNGQIRLIGQVPVFSPDTMDHVLHLPAEALALTSRAALGTTPVHLVFAIDTESSPLIDGWSVTISDVRGVAGVGTNASPVP